jgi:EAL domain-containing protein (putative c-di-GMP-specific phosphodiesterase class I)
VVLRLVGKAGEAPDVLGRRIVEALSRPVSFEGAGLRIGASVGIASTPLSSKNDLLTNADIALYKAKSSGRGSVVTFDEKDFLEMKEARARSDDIQDAIERRAFTPVFQPQIDARSGSIVALEALARWEHPTRGLVGPAEFISTARDLGILNDIDRIIFEKSLDLCREGFEGEMAPGLSFNVSQDRLLSPALIEDIRSAADYPGSIALELLETIIFEDPDAQFHLQLDTLRDLGVSLEIDDFGSGRASIVALEDIAPDRLKIDRRLVSAVASVERSEKLVRAIVDIARALDIGITAEGVETPEQAAMLKAIGCDRLQGFFFGRPMPFKRIVEEYRFAPAGQRAV